MPAPTPRLRFDEKLSARGLASWSPDGQRVAYVRESATRDELHVLDLGSAAHRRLGNSLPAAVLFPDWSPDGGRVALSAGQTARHVGVFVVDVATGRARVLRADAASYRCPSWAPTGDWLVFQSDRASPPTTDAASAARMLQNLEIYAMRRDGTRVRRLTTNTHFDAHPA